jgi:hypothetical protein
MATLYAEVQEKLRALPPTSIRTTSSHYLEPPNGTLNVGLMGRDLFESVCRRCMMCTYKTQLTSIDTTLRNYE